MSTAEKKNNVLIVSSDDKLRSFFVQILPPREYEIPPTAKSAGEARRRLISQQYNIVVINTPLPDETGLELAEDLSDRSLGVLAIADIQSFDQVCHTLEDFGVLTVTKPLSRQQAYAYIKLLSAFSARLTKMEKENKSLQEKVMDIRIVDRAKWILIKNEGMTEEEAHHTIEHNAMENRESRRKAAEEIIRKYEE